MEDAACSYKGLMAIEGCYLSLKRIEIKMMPMFHWASRRIGAHVKTSFLALMIERVAEREGGMLWIHIRREFDCLSVTELFDFKNRVLMRNEIPAKTDNILKALKRQTPRQILTIENQP